MASELERAIADHQAGRRAAARGVYERLLERSPDDPDVLNYLGILEFEEKHPDLALELLRRSLDHAPENPHAWLNLGNVQMSVDGPEAGLASYLKAIECDPTLVPAWTNRAIAERHLEMYEEAIASLQRAIHCAPGLGSSYEMLGILLYRVGRREEGQKVYRAWLDVEPNNPIPRHMLAATGAGPAPPRAEEAYVTRLFDAFADSFDRMLGQLGYRAPEILARAIAEAVDLSGARHEILDAGCGTGLCGLLLRPAARRLSGVDLSPAMVSKARERGVYDELTVRELVAHMRRRPRCFDIVVSADTLVYFGDLAPPIAAAARCLRPGGILAFTVEHLGAKAAPDPAANPSQERQSEPLRAEDFQIQSSGRYAHAPHYVEGLLRKFGFVPLQLGRVVLRKELGQDVVGLACVARRADGRLDGDGRVDGVTLLSGKYSYNPPV